MSALKDCSKISTPSSIATSTEYLFALASSSQERSTPVAPAGQRRLIGGSGKHGPGLTAMDIEAVIKTTPTTNTEESAFFIFPSFLDPEWLCIQLTQMTTISLMTAIVKNGR
jgi:hypothetical protein